MLTAAWTKFRPHATQCALWKCSDRFVAVPAGRGSGKTELAKRRLVRYLAVKKDWSDPRYFYGAPTTDQAKMIAWEPLLALIPTEWVARVDRSMLRIFTVFGSELRVVGMDRPQRVEGPQWDGIVLDESCDHRPGVFDRNVLPMLTHRKGWCWRIGVPKRQGSSAKEYRKFYEDAASGALPESAGFTWPSSDILPPEALRMAREKMDPKDFREQFEARFETAGGQLFYAFDRRFNVRPCEYRSSSPLIVSNDFNVDPMAWVIGHRKGPRGIEWIDEIWLRNTNTRQALNTLWERYRLHSGGFEFYGDATSDQRHTSASESDYQQILMDKRFKAIGRTLHYPKGNPSRLNRFAACNMMLCDANGDRRMHVDPKCVHLIDDLESRYCPPGESLPKDSGDLGHPTDAMGYLVQTLFPLSIPVASSSEVYISQGSSSWGNRYR